MKPSYRDTATPVPGCVCPAGYVRDDCQGHPSPVCQFHGLFGVELRDARLTAREWGAVFEPTREAA